MHWALRLLGERNSLCHIQALLWLLVKQRALPRPWGGTRLSILPAGSREAEDICPSRGAPRREQAGWQLPYGVLLRGSKMLLGLFRASLGGHTSPHVWGTLTNREERLCAAARAVPGPGSSRIYGLSHHSAQLPTLCSSPGAVTRDCGQR